MNESTTKISNSEIKLLKEQLANKDAELAIINSVGEAMSKQLDVETVTGIVGDKIREIFDTEVTEILLLDKKTNIISVPYSYYNGYQKIEEFKLGEGLTSVVINSAQPLLLGTLNEQIEAGAIYDDELGEADDTESYLGVPIKFGDDVFGVVSIQSYKKNVYNEENTRFLSMLSSKIGVALHNAHLYEQSQQLLSETELRNTELSVINSVQEGLVAKMEIQGIYDLVGEKIRGIFDAQVVSIGSYDYENELCHFKYDIEKGERFYDEPRNFNSIDKHIIKTKKTLLINENLLDEAEKLGEKKPKAAEGTEMPKSAIWVPMMIGDDVKGYVSLQNVDRENAFGESEVRLLTTLANSMSVALENASLFDQTKKLLAESEQRNTELGVINSVQEGLVKQMDLQAIYNLVGEQIREIFDTQVVAVATFNHSDKTEHFNFVIEKGERYHPASRKFDKVREELIETKKLILINNNYPEAAKKYGMKVVSGTESPKSLLFVPMVVGGNVNGYISLQNIDRENAFSESDVRLLTTLTNSMSVALENARLFDETTKLLDETKQQAIELGIINSVGDGLAKQLDFQAIIDLVGDKIREVFNAEVVSISTYEKETDEIFHHYAVEGEKRYSFDKPHPIDSDRKEIIQSRKPLKFGTAKELVEHSGSQVVAGELPESFMGVPILMGSDVTGVITVQDIKTKNLYSDKDVRLLMTLASNMGVALENARLFGETKRLLNETQQRNVELSILNAIQEGLVMEMDFESIINLVGDKFREALGFQDLGIRLYDKETDTLHFPYEYEHGEKLNIESMKPTPSSKYVLANGKMLYLKENTDEEAQKYGISGQMTIPGTDRSKSLVMVPIMLGNEAKGLILIEDYEKENAFTDSEIRLLTTVSNSMSVALENARLFNETNRLLDESQQRNTELSILNTIQEGMVKEMDFNGVIKLVGDKLREVLNYQDIGIRIYDKENDLVHFPYEYEHGNKLEIEPMEPGGISRHILKSKKLLLLKKNDEESIKALGIEGVTVIPGTDRSKSMIAVPLVSGNESRGLFIIENYEKEDAFDETDIRLLTTLANSMSVALENARLFDETNRLLKETEQRSAELTVINSVQEGLVENIELQSIFELVGDKIRDIFDSQVVIIASFDHDKNEEIFNYVIEKDERIYAQPRKYDKVREYLIQHKEHIVINDNTEEAEKKYGMKTYKGTDKPKSLLFVPLILGDTVNGYISLQNIDRHNAFSESDVRLLSTLTNSMSVALENARLFDKTNRLLHETEHRSAELSVINSVQEGLAKELDLHNIYELVGERLCSLFPDSQTLVIRSFDHDNKVENWEYAIEKGERLEVKPRPFNWANKILIETKKPLEILKNYVETAQKYGGKGVTKGQPPKSAVFVPVIINDVVRGSISLQNVDKENAFDDSDVRLVTTLVNSMSVAIENARLFNETLRLLEESKKRTAELSTVNSISQAIVAHLEIDKLINLVGDKVRDLFNANIVYLALLNENINMIEFPYGYGDEYPPLKLGEGLTSKIILKKEPLLINRKIDEREEKIIGTPSSSYLGVPIPVGDEIIGVLSVQSTEKENLFDEDDMRLLNTIAAHVGIAINNANSYKELNETLENLKSTQDQLVAQEKLASLGQLTAGIAHEIKNPLNFVNNFSELSVGLVDELGEEIDTLKEKIEDDSYSDVKEILALLQQNAEKIKEHGKRADSIVHSMLQHSRGKTGDRQETDINSMLDEDLNLVYHGLRAQDSSFNIKIERDYNKSLQHIKVVPQDISRVFLNILTNGCYEAHRKKVETNSDESARIKVKTADVGSFIEVRIKDNGSGIPKKIQEDLFKPFFTTKPAGKGTGLGLSISYDIVVHEHNGEIKFETKEGEFTEFIIRLPK